MKSDSLPGKVRHHAVLVASEDEAVAFYGLLGFDDVAVRETPDPRYIEVLSGGAWTALLVIKLKNTHSDVLELLIPKLRDGTPADGQTPDWSHLALTVNDCIRTAADLSRLGGSVIGGPTIDPRAPYRVAYIRDPFGNLIELVEPLSTAPKEGLRRG